MWIFLSDSFLSIVAHSSIPGSLLVRARHEGDIERAFPDIAATVDESADYRYRAVIPREVVAQRLSEVAGSIDYPNFKNTVHDHDRRDAYMEIWSTMYRLQLKHRQR
jgi:hypothetical protein